MDLKARFPEKDTTTCCVGSPGPGVHLGFAGWGQPDAEADPAMPLDMEVARLGLEGAFQKVVCKDLMHRIHGDCMLTHGFKGLAALGAPGAEIEIEFLSLGDVLRASLDRLDKSMFAEAQILEKLAFGPPMDKDGVLYPQALISPQKARVLLRDARLVFSEILAKPMDDMDIPVFPDDVRMDVDDKVWESSEANFTKREKLFEDRPNCVLCERVVTKRDHDRQFFSRYCKEHYAEARRICDKALRDAFTVKITCRK